MSDRLPWFKCCPEKLLSALTAMEADEGYIYVHILLRIYEVGGPISDPIRALARRAGMTERRANAAINLLIDSGKVNMTSDGKIDSVTTHETLAEIGKFSDGQSRAAKIGAEKRAEKNQQKQQNDSAAAAPTLSQLRQETIDTTSLRSVVAPKRQPRKQNRRSGIEANAQPNERNRAYSESLGMTADAFRSEWQGFRSHHRAKGSIMADWDAAWETWARNWTKFSPRAGPQGRSSGRETLTQIAMGNFFDEPQSPDQLSSQFGAVANKPSTRDFDLDLSKQDGSDGTGQILDFSPRGAAWR